MVSLPPGSRLGRYRVVELIGRGGMATVFRALDPNLDRYIAVKVLPSYYTDDPTFVERFAQEAQTVARLRHANILQIYDFGEDKGFTYIVTELVTGGTLQDKLGVDPISGEETLRLMGPLAEGLDYAHSQGIVHRDLKPANVLLGDNEFPILADFGLARMLEASMRFTQTSQALGTPEYMSPEQAMGADADHRSDLYAFGVMLYQMLVGQTPFRTDTPAATLMAHVHKAMPLPTLLNPNIAPRIEAILLKCLAKDPEDRFQSAKDMITALTMAGGPAGPMSDDTGSVTIAMDAAGPGTGITEEMTTPISPEAVSLPTARLGTGDAVGGGDVTEAVAV
ncbi:MAG: serine/threonine-protein kinase, partial [SAR202 cluster bacterium]|nr:serine/threonine-protein kinase [SAR202 cluster bacterium]